jgi:hypothetical protein
VGVMCGCLCVCVWGVMCGCLCVCVWVCVCGCVGVCVCVCGGESNFKYYDSNISDFRVTHCTPCKRLCISCYFILSLYGLGMLTNDG